MTTQDTIHGAAPGCRRLSNTHPHKRGAVPVVKGSTHTNRTGVSRTFLSRSTLHICGQHLRIKVRVVSYYHQRLPLWEAAPHSERRGILNNASTHNTNPQIPANPYPATVHHKHGLEELVECRIDDMLGALMSVLLTVQITN